MLTDHSTGIRVLFTGQYWPGANSMYIARAFEGCGAILRILNETALWPDWTEKTSRGIRRMLRPLIEREWNHQLLALLDNFKPDLVYITNADYCWPQTVDAVRARGIPVMCFYHDPPWKNRLGSRFSQNISLFDLVATTRRWHESEFKDAGAKAVVVVRFGYEPSVHRPLLLNDRMNANYGSDISFIGTYENRRARELQELVSINFPYSFRLWGGYWDKLPISSPLRSYWQERLIYEQEIPVIYSASKVALHWLNWEPDSVDYARRRGDQHNSRTFQIAACGGAMMLAQRTDEHRMFFEEDKEAVFFDNFMELRNKLEYWLKPEHDEKRKQVATAARIRCLKEDYSWTPVVKNFLKHFGFWSDTSL